MVQFLSELRFEWLNLAMAMTLFFIMAPVMLYYHQKRKLARIKFSSLKNLKKTTPSIKVRIRNLPLWLRLLSLFFLLIAFAHPYQEREIKDQLKESDKEEHAEKKEDQRKKIEVPTEGISIQLLMDRSGSMGTMDQGNGRPRVNYMKFENTLLSKLDVVKIISKRFIGGTRALNQGQSLFEGRGNDLIGLFTFARYPLVACPLTLRHELLLDTISQLEVVQLREEDGTYIGYALERAILQIIDTKSRTKEEDAYNIKSSIIILITDGEQVIRSEDAHERHLAMLPSEAARLAVDNGIKIYTIAIVPQAIYDENGTVIGSASNFSVEEIQTAAEVTGGKFYLAGTGDLLENIYHEISTLEKSKLPAKKELEARVERSREIKRMETEKVVFFPFFLWAGLLTLLGEIGVTIFYFRRIP
jgi:Ca-activated chloride channel homolog